MHLSLAVTAAMWPPKCKELPVGYSTADVDVEIPELDVTAGLVPSSSRLATLPTIP